MQDINISAEQLWVYGTRRVIVYGVVDRDGVSHVQYSPEEWSLCGTPGAIGKIEVTEQEFRKFGKLLRDPVFERRYAK